MKNLKQEKCPQLTLVGAGPGDPELITLKGVKAIANADCILYDALVNPELLQHAPANVPKIFVGKRVGQHSAKQEEINRMIVHYAHLWGNVVRLKGGDPFVFGRGQEEIDYAKSHGLLTSLVPGLSSALSVPASAGIPLTERGVSQSFWVITGMLRTGEISRDIELAAQSSATVVVLMGMTKIEEISGVFCRHGRSDLDVAIIQNGTAQGERSIIGKAHNIAQLARDHQFASPAIIVFGGVSKRLNANMLTAVKKETYAIQAEALS
ncbi:uroporphyrinogen-III C-methyltransferase [Persicobacter psychrovividus]|uniref:uroporphyrinogen-III C-methyltransferase n=1 Tax=Persicobacter psychrovividus TaxID=387638 RepID=A0ABN6LFY8_9BACT|nr:uroporphyrinogen-III C-methyltransferase [Persicobacter psychrovividus]